MIVKSNTKAYRFSSFSHRYFDLLCVVKYSGKCNDHTTIVIVVNIDKIKSILKSKQWCSCRLTSLLSVLSLFFLFFLFFSLLFFRWHDNVQYLSHLELKFSTCLIATMVFFRLCFVAQSIIISRRYSQCTVSSRWGIKSQIEIASDSLSPR